MNIIGKIENIRRDYISGKYKISIELEDCRELEKIEEMKKLERLDIEIKKYRKKRSKDANAYCWVLIGKLAAEMGITSQEIYRRAIKEAGVYTVLSGNTSAIKRFEKIWENNGLGWFCEVIGKRNDETSIAAYYGSSSYDTKEMTRLLDCLISDCKALNIETLREQEIESLLNEWEAYE